MLQSVFETMCKHLKMDGLYSWMGLEGIDRKFLCILFSRNH